MNRFRKQKLDGVEVESDGKAPVVTGISTEGSNKTSTGDMDHDLSSFAEMHEWDPNLDPKKLHAIKDAVYDHDVEAENALENEIEEQSPYPEVVASVQNWDDETLPANTVRSWIIGLTFVTIGSGMNMLFSLRQPTITVTMLVTQICTYPVGWLMAKVLPTHQFNLFGLKWSFNPGPFNKKEHTLIVVMANVAFAGGAAYSTFALEAMRGFYGINLGVWFSILLTLCTQVTGIAMAGLFRRFLVFPSSSLYPSVLPNCVLFNTLHDESHTSDPDKTNGWKISRFRFFSYVMLGSFIWYWFPGFIFKGLSTIAWVTWYVRDLLL
jgi:OPT family oligopeptide transporter